LSRLGRRLRRALPLVALTPVLVLVVGLALFSVVSTTSDSESFGDDAVALADYRALTLGRSRDEIERRIGDGKDALEFRETGAALEPMDADCVYYPQAGTGNYRDIIQLCFRDDRLVRKRTFSATPGPPLR
jgi:hypothetical protein